jgi:hypothetical protein
MIMKRLHHALIVASLLALPLSSHAAGDASLSRAQVCAELIAAEQAGQYPHSKVHYPDAAASRAAMYVASRTAHDAEAGSSYGPSDTGGFASGTHALHARIAAGGRAPADDIYRGH